MPNLTIEEAQARLPELIHNLSPGDEVVITENNQPVAKLVSSPALRRVPRLGTLRGTVLSMKRFDEPLEDFNEYIE